MQTLLTDFESVHQAVFPLIPKPWTLFIKIRVAEFGEPSGWHRKIEWTISVIGHVVHSVNAPTAAAVVQMFHDVILPRLGGDGIPRADAEPLGFDPGRPSDTEAIRAELLRRVNVRPAMFGDHALVSHVLTLTVEGDVLPRRLTATWTDADGGNALPLLFTLHLHDPINDEATYCVSVARGDENRPAPLTLCL